MSKGPVEGVCLTLIWVDNRSEHISLQETTIANREGVMHPPQPQSSRIPYLVMLYPGRVRMLRRGPSKAVSRAPHSQASPVQHMSVDHGRIDIPMPQ